MMAFTAVTARAALAAMAICALWAASAEPARAGGAGEGPPLVLVALGDSLTAGFGLGPADTFPAQLERALKTRGHNVTVANGGVSGDTTAAALERLEWAIAPETAAVIVALGGNDALRGLPPADMEAGLEKILDALKQRGIPVLLAGMKAPQNWGPAYAASFDAVFPRLARKHDVVFYPFFLEGVALDPRLNLDDGIHPSRQGIARIVEGILPQVEALLARVHREHRGTRAPGG